MTVYTARFPKQDSAEQFAARITEPGWSAQNVAQRGRTVTWTVDNPSAEYFLDMLESVGYYGSTQSRKATLTSSTREAAGRPPAPAPISY